MILVAGGTGLLGRRVVRQLSTRGEPVRVLTRDSRRAGCLPAGVQIVTGDLRHGGLESVVAGCSIVISAVHGFTGPSRTSPAAVDRGGNRALIEASQSAGVERFVLVSVVGAGPDHPMSLHRMKHAAEQQLLRTCGVRGVVVRATSFLETWLAVIGAKLPGGGPALVLGPGRNPINFVAADDVAAFVCLAASGDSRVKDEVSVGGPQDLTFTDLAEQLLARAGRNEAPKHIPLPALRAMSVLARPVHPNFARQAHAAVAMNALDMTFDAMPTRRSFPDIPVTTLAQVLASTRS